MIGEKEREKIQKLLKKVQKDPDLLAIIHFGSSLTSSKYNDIDLCLIAKNSLAIEKKLKYKLFLPEHYEIHFFHDIPLYIRHEVLKKGKFLLIKDEDLLYDVVYKFIKEYAYFEPHFKKYLELIKNA